MFSFFIFRRPIKAGWGSYGDNPSTHPDFDSDLWMEVGSSSGPAKNWVYELSNTTNENL